MDLIRGVPVDWEGFGEWEGMTQAYRYFVWQLPPMICLSFFSIIFLHSHSIYVRVHFVILIFQGERRAVS